MRRFFLFFLMPLFLIGRPVEKKEIPAVMERLFSYHIENKELTPLVVKRCLKLYIEQFDQDKSYLLEEEVLPYLSLKDEEARKIGARMQKGDYQDFVKLDLLFQQGIARSRRLRPELENHLSKEEVGLSMLTPPAAYPKSEGELKERLKIKMSKFMYYQQRKTPVFSEERRMKVYDLMEKKLYRFENPYLFLTFQGEPVTEKAKEEYQALRILKAFAKSLDAHSSFFSEEEAGEMRLNLEKQFEGYGIVLSEGIDGVVISEVLPGSPAAKSGLVKENDIVVEIDGTAVYNLSFDEVLDLMKRKDLQKMTFGLQRMAFSNQKGVESTFWKVSLAKAPITMDQDRLTYTYEPYGSGIIAKMTLHSFYESGNGITSEKDIKQALQELSKKGEIKGLILDLRDNAGGFLSQAVKVAGLFVSSGVIVISKYGKNEIHYLRSVDPNVYYQGPLIILTSKLSASAAEIVAQALQDYGVGLIVGDERTFGKGSIQYQTVTDAKADLFFKVTVGKYYTVSGKTTQVTGVIADILVPTQYAPFNVGEKFLEYPLKSDRVTPAYKDSLSDVDHRMRGWFVANYLPYVQQPVTFYRSMLPELKKNSATRIQRNSDYQLFLKNQEQIKARINGDTSAKGDLGINFGQEDLQMAESVNILKDMIYLQSKRSKTRAFHEERSPFESFLKKAS